MSVTNGLQAQQVLCYRRIEALEKVGTYYRFRLFNGTGYLGEADVFVPEGCNALALVDAIAANMHEAISGIVRAVAT